MSHVVAVACPHCGKTSSHAVGVTDGSAGVQCRFCHRSFRIYMRKGEVWEVR